MTLRVSSYNIRLCIEQGVQAVADVIRALNPDIVALQEVGRHWTMGPQGDLTKQLAEQSGLAHHIFIPALFDGDGAYGIALLSKYPIIEHEKIELPQRDDEQRVLCRAVLQPEGAQAIDVWTSHFSIAEWDREQQLCWLAAAMETRPPDLFLGDINTDPSDPLLGDWPLTNAWSATPEKTYPAKKPSQTLDSIFYSTNWAVTQEAQTTKTLASDHFPISAVFAQRSDGDGRAT